MISSEILAMEWRQLGEGIITEGEYYNMMISSEILAMEWRQLGEGIITEGEYYNMMISSQILAMEWRQLGEGIITDYNWGYIYIIGIHWFSINFMKVRCTLDKFTRYTR